MLHLGCSPSQLPTAERITALLLVRVKRQSPSSQCISITTARKTLTAVRGWWGHSEGEGGRHAVELVGEFGTPQRSREARAFVGVTEDRDGTSYTVQHGT